MAISRTILWEWKNRVDAYISRGHPTGGCPRESSSWRLPLLRALGRELNRVPSSYLIFDAGSPGHMCPVRSSFLASEAGEPGAGWEMWGAISG